jgi:hypothetical protein
MFGCGSLRMARFWLDLASLRHGIGPEAVPTFQPAYRAPIGGLPALSQTDDKSRSSWLTFIGFTSITTCGTS